MNNGFFTEEAFERIVDRDFEEENDDDFDEEDQSTEVFADMDMWNEWLSKLCEETGAESAEDLSYEDLQSELSDIRGNLKDEEIWNGQGNEQFIATLREYIEVLEDLSEVAHV